MSDMDSLTDVLGKLTRALRPGATPPTPDEIADYMARAAPEVQQAAVAAFRAAMPAYWELPTVAASRTDWREFLQLEIVGRPLPDGLPLLLPRPKPGADGDVLIRLEYGTADATAYGWITEWAVYSRALTAILTLAPSSIPHVLAPYVQAWLDNPRPVLADMEREWRIIPIGLASKDVAAGGRLPGIYQPRLHSPDGQLILPGLAPDADLPRIALPSVIYDMGVDAARQGRGAPLALRLWVEAILAYPYALRDGYPAALEVKVGDLLRRLYPTLDKPPKPSLWAKVLRPQLGKAIEQLDKAWFPYENRDTGQRWSWRAVMVSGLPTDMDDTLRIVIDLPPGVKSGPKVSPYLARAGLVSGPAYRLLLNLPLGWWEPGVKQYPVRARGRQIWVSHKGRKLLEVSEPIDDNELVRLAYPTNQVRRSRRANERDTALKALDALVKMGAVRLEYDGGHRYILPPTADTQGPE